MPASMRSMIDSQDADVYVSAATAWELATKYRLGKLPEAAVIVETFFEVIAQCEFTPLSITVEHGHRAGLLPGDHKDPFDRMLAAQAIMGDMDLVTADPKLAGFGARVVWQ